MALLKTEFYLATVAASIRVHGWHPRGSSEEPTADRALKLTEDSTFLPKPEDLVTARQALEWAKGLGDDPIILRNKYLWKLCDLARKEEIEEIDIGFAAGIVGSFLHEKERFVQEEHLHDSQFIGEVGDVLEIKVKVISITKIPSKFGKKETTIYRFLDTVGNVLVWLSTKDIEELRVHAHVTIRGFVKEHEHYRGVNQTRLTRVSVIER